MGVMKMAFSTYQEPDDGPRARVRLISDQPSPFVYPARACADTSAAGAGVAPDSRPGLMNGLEYRTIGMPKVAVAGGRAITEIYARAGEPIAFTLTAGGCGQNFCPQDRSLCHQTRTFVPAENTDYVATIWRQAGACEIHVFQIKSRGKGYIAEPQASEVAAACAK